MSAISQRLGRTKPFEHESLLDLLELSRRLEMLVEEMEADFPRHAAAPGSRAPEGNPLMPTSAHDLGLLLDDELVDQILLAEPPPATPSTAGYPAAGSRPATVAPLSVSPRELGLLLDSDFADELIVTGPPLALLAVPAVAASARPGHDDGHPAAPRPAVRANPASARSAHDQAHAAAPQPAVRAVQASARSAHDEAPGEHRGDPEVELPTFLVEPPMLDGRDERVRRASWSGRGWVVSALGGHIARWNRL